MKTTLTCRGWLLLYPNPVHVPTGFLYILSHKMHLPLCLCIMLVLYVLVQCLFSCLNILYVFPCQHHLRLKTPRGQGPCLFNSFCTVPRIKPCTDRCLKNAFWWWLASLRDSLGYSYLSTSYLAVHQGTLACSTGHQKINGTGPSCSTLWQVFDLIHC